MAVQTEFELTAGTLDGMDSPQSGRQTPDAPAANGSHSIHADPPMPGVPAIDLQGVVKAYDRTRVVDEVTAQIPAGGATAIIGPNGAGKSTLLSMVGRLLQADGGTIAVGGQDVFDSDTRALARKLAVLRQENTTTVRLTVWDLVSFGRFPHHGGRPGPDDERLVSQALGYMDLHSFAGRYLDELSGGQRQRAYIAMVLAQDTDVLLLDEPLNNLDMKHAVETRWGAPSSSCSTTSTSPPATRTPSWR